ncbi:MAG: GNAT family N-acetyltransferase [Sphaerobacter sp.]|nr:GNAT family N-acetyltransferase [Sphaerobacter sp.]
MSADGLMPRDAQVAHPAHHATPSMSAPSDGMHRSSSAVGALRVVAIGTDDERWAAFVTSRPDALTYHHPAWSRVIQEAYGHTPAHLACEDEGRRLQGVLPLCYQRGILSGRRLSSLPNTPVCGPLATSPAAATALLQAAADRVRSEPGLHLQIKSLAPDLDPDGKLLARVDWVPTYILELPTPPEAPSFQSARHRERIKRAVKKATKNGVLTREAETSHDLRAWYTLYLETMRRLAVPPRPFQFFEAAWRWLKPLGLATLLLAEQHTPSDTQLLGGSLFFMCGQSTRYSYAGYRRETADLRPNDLIHWTAIHAAWERGEKYFDFGEVSPGHDGLIRFKTKWGAQPWPVYRYYYPSARDPIGHMAHPGGRIQALRQAVWCRLPLSVTERLGGWIYQHL